MWQSQPFYVQLYFVFLCHLMLFSVLFFFILLLFFCLFKLDLNFSVVKLIVSNLGEMTAHGIILAISTIILALLLLLLL